MLKWSIELCGLEITFASRTAIKAQTLADFLVEHTFTEAVINELIGPADSDQWILKVDDAINSKGISIGMVITSLHGKYEE